MLSEDYHYWLNVARHYEIGVVEDYLTDYRQHGDQITGPQMRPELMAAVKQLVWAFVEKTPMDEIIPGLRVPIYGNALIGLILLEHKLYPLAQSYLERALPNSAAHLGLGLLRLNERQFTQAKSHFQQIQDDPFRAKAEEAHALLERVQHLCQKPEFQRLDEKTVNLDPEVVQLRKDLSHFDATVIRLLLRLAKGRNDACISKESTHATHEAFAL